MIATKEKRSDPGPPISRERPLPRSALACGIRELDITLIRPTNYTDDGYPIQMRVGVIRSNTLTQMGALARDIVNYPFFADVSLNVRLIDEAIQRVPAKEIRRRSAEPGVKAIVMLVGVQSNQFPRAQDIASWFLPEGIPVIVGGFHVSGMLATVGLTPSLREAMCAGIILVAGEVEGPRLPAIVEDVVRGDTEPLYDFLNPTPDLSNLPLPRLTKADLSGFASPYSTIDTGRGCVFNCDFCTIINVQGRTMRCREPAQVVEFIRQNYHESGIVHCFFTDDNLARNPRWRELFSGLIRLREKEGIPFTFMMQSDLAAQKMPPGDFFPLAARAGCNQAFFGVESLNPDNLRAKAKFQNRVSEYRDLVTQLHSLGMACHAGYILGLPFDTPPGIRRDITELQTIGFDSASFYILSPLPGSNDYQRWWRERRWMEADFNTYDSAHVAVMPERMTREELNKAYDSAWNQFYSVDHMVSVLRGWRSDWSSYWNRLFFFAAYLYASRIEGLHPMNCGFWTVRHRNDRRSTFPRQSLVSFWWNRLRTIGRRLSGMVALFFELEEVWLRSRPKSKIEDALHDMIAQSKRDVVDWRELKARELAVFYRRLRNEIPSVKAPSVTALWLRKHNPFAGAYTRSYVRRVWRQWYLHIWNPVKWIEVVTFECVNGIRFLTHLLAEGK
ncbi:MAG: radical SAM protein [Ignavibacteria bacterium]|nr:radical SAM protein [Ignavibacteria bacterium]